MRHHFTKSERLAITVMAALHQEFTDMESGPIRKGARWIEGYPLFYWVRDVRRVVTFTLNDPIFPLRVGTRIFLKGREVEKTIIPQEVAVMETTWRVDKVMRGYLSEEKGVVWRKLHIPPPSGDPHRDFPHYLLENTEPVASLDA